MREFGSDFHYISVGESEKNSLFSFYPSASYYADGRQALIALYRNQGWKRIWVPTYFCRNVVGTWISAGVNVVFYTDYPGADDQTIVEQIPAACGDAVFRVNYFGQRGFRSKASLCVPVVEDHTHDFLGDWATKSDADWCIASLRKTLPIPEGGMLWSPVGHKLPELQRSSGMNRTEVDRRWRAMRLKADYLRGEDIDKEFFRNEFIETERYFEEKNVYAIDHSVADYIQHFNIQEWYSQKRRNWMILDQIESQKICPFLPENKGDHNPFSYTILCESKDFREDLRRRLIEKKVYPSILWHIPENSPTPALDISSRMLSIHCDGRYTEDDIKQMKLIIESSL